MKWRSGRRWPGWPLLSALLLILVSWTQIRAAEHGIQARFVRRDGVPMRFLLRVDLAGRDGDIPGVLVAHGFSGSQQLMLGYGIYLAQAGYGVMLWDFDGHGANPRPLGETAGSLQANVDSAYAVLAAQPEIDPARVAILGHSMGSGAALAAGIEAPQRYGAVIAISPTDGPVTPQAPRNLQLQAGAWEPPFYANAVDLLQRAGGHSEAWATDAARQLVRVPRAEHITILFSRVSHRAARDWLDTALGQRGPAVTADRRLWWYGLQLIGWLGVATIAMARWGGRDWTARRPVARWSWAALVVTPALASLLLAGTGRLIALDGLGGLRVGGALAAWFLLVGILWWLAGFRPARPRQMGLLQGVVLFTLLWLALGPMGQRVWLPWMLIPARLWRWPLLALALAPWSLAAYSVVDAAGGRIRLAWWLGQSALLVGGLLLAVSLVPSLSFLVIVLPILPLFLGLLAWMAHLRPDPWVAGVAQTLLFAWLLLAVFPLAG